MRVPTASRRMRIAACCGGGSAALPGFLWWDGVNVPELFDLEPGARVRLHDVHDDAVEVDQHPFGLVETFDTGLQTGPLGVHDDVVTNAFDVPCGAAAAHDHVVGDGRQLADVEGL